jgi:hypothetical protein
MASRKRKSVPSVEEIRSREVLKPSPYAAESYEPPELPPEDQPEEEIGEGGPGTGDGSGEGMPVILEEYGPDYRTPQSDHEKSVLGAWYNAVRHYLRGDVSYDKQGNWINYGARIQGFAGETIGGDRIETRLSMIERYALADAIADGPYDN